MNSPTPTITPVILAPTPPTPVEAKVSPYYFFCEGVAAIVMIPAGLSSDGWGRIQKAFMDLAVPVAKQRFAHVGCYRLYRDRQHGGVFWDEELANADGASFLILAMEDSTKESICACQGYIRATQDVVRLRILRPTRWTGVEMAEIMRIEQLRR